MEHRPVRTSYILTTRNRARFLVKILENVREFITPTDELVIVDGGSTDGTAQVVEANRDIIRTFLSEPDRSEAHALNKALARAQGRFIKFITDDDYFYPEAMRTLVRVMEEHPELDAIQCGGERWQQQGDQLLFLDYCHLEENRPATPEAIFDYLGVGLGLIMTRRAVEVIGGAGGNYLSVDGDIITKLIECRCPLKYLDLKLYKWILHPHSGTQKKARLTQEALLFDARMGRWEKAFSQPPEILIRQLGLEGKANADAFATLLSAASRLQTPKGEWILKVTAWFLQRVLALQDSMQQRRQQEIPKPVMEPGHQPPEPNWTGQLR